MGYSTDVSNNITSTAMTRAEFGEQDTSESYFENNIENLRARIVNVRVDFTNFAGSTLIWGNPSFGIWGSFFWGNGGNTSFILGNSTAGVLGRSRLGTNESLPVRFLENYMWQDYVENFTTTTYKDTMVSDGGGWGIGSYVFNIETTQNMSSGSYTSHVSVSAGSIQLN